MRVRTLGEFRQLTANLPDNTRLLANARGHNYRDTGACVVTAIATPPDFEPDVGDNPDLYGLQTEEEVKRNRQTVVVVS